jgi:hypothetical protein
VLISALVSSVRPLSVSESLDSFVLAMVGAGFVLDKHVKYCVVSSDSAEDDSVGKKVTEFHIWQFKVTGM